MRDLLIPDLNDTTTVDPELLRMRSEVDNLERGLPTIEDKEAAGQLRKLIKGAKSEIKNYEKAKGRKPSILIGYMPASKATTLRNKVIGGGGTEAFVDRANNLASASRESLAWAIKGWNLRGKAGDVEFVSEPESVCGFDFTKATPLMVSILEHMGWLDVLTTAAWEFNNVSEAEKKR